MPEQLIRITEVKRIVGLSRSTIYAAMETATFPRPVKIGPRAVAWRLSEIEEWVASLSEDWDPEP